MVKFFSFIIIVVVTLLDNHGQYFSFLIVVAECMVTQFIGFCHLEVRKIIIRMRAMALSIMFPSFFLFFFFLNCHFLLHLILEKWWYSFAFLLFFSFYGDFFAWAAVQGQNMVLVTDPLLLEVKGLLKGLIFEAKAALI